MSKYKFDRDKFIKKALKPSQCYSFDGKHDMKRTPAGPDFDPGWEYHECQNPRCTLKAYFSPGALKIMGIKPLKEGEVT